MSSLSFNQIKKNPPAKAGVYFFVNAAGEVLYVGKAASLKARIASYFQKKSRSLQPVKSALLEEATAVRWEVTGSEILALIKEAEYIKKIKPRYNVALRDDKKYFYVVITNHRFPKVFLTHQPEKGRGNKTIIGPFTSGSSLKKTLKILRKTFPFCTCKKAHKRTCMNSRLGLCRGFCCQASLLSEKNDGLISSYEADIEKMMRILRGRSKKLLGELEKDMRRASAQSDFELAAQIRDQLKSINNIISHGKIINDHEHDQLPRPNKEVLYDQGVNLLTDALNGIFREKSLLEVYDCSHLKGRGATAAMVVFEEGKREKKYYKRFGIREANRLDDLSMLREVFARRLEHADWPWPSFVLVDGGRAQLNAALKYFKFKKPSPFVLSLAKEHKLVYSELGRTPIPINALPDKLGSLLVVAVDEAHRFARSYHFFLRGVPWK